LVALVALALLVVLLGCAPGLLMGAIDGAMNLAH
jgi:hypothetical protein